MENQSIGEQPLTEVDNVQNSIVKNEDGVFVNWGDNELEPVINAKEEIDRVYPLFDKNVRTFDELEKIVEFIKWYKGDLNPLK